MPFTRCALRGAGPLLPLFLTLAPLDGQERPSNALVPRASIAMGVWSAEAKTLPTTAEAWVIAGHFAFSLRTSGTPEEWHQRMITAGTSSFWWEEASDQRVVALAVGPAFVGRRGVGWLAAGPALVEHRDGMGVRNTGGSPMLDVGLPGARSVSSLGAQVQLKGVLIVAPALGIGAGASWTVGPMRPLPAFHLTMDVGRLRPD